MMSKSNMNKNITAIKKLAHLGKYQDAAKIADEIRWGRVKDVKTLNMVSDIYEKCERYHDAKRVMMVIYNRVDANKRLVYKMCELSAKAGDLADAEEFYWEYSNLAPKDPGKLILAYYIMCASKESDEKKIEVLELYIKEDFDEKWAYKLAQIYYRAGQTERCIRTCDEIILWYSGDRYGAAALRLKHKCLGIEDEVVYQEVKTQTEKEAEADKAKNAAVVSNDTEIVLDSEDATDEEDIQTVTTDNEKTEQAATNNENGSELWFDLKTFNKDIITREVEEDGVSEFAGTISGEEVEDNQSEELTDGEKNDAQDSDFEYSSDSDVLKCNYDSSDNDVLDEDFEKVFGVKIETDEAEVCDFIYGKADDVDFAEDTDSEQMSLEEYFGESVFNEEAAYEDPFEDKRGAVTEFGQEEVVEFETPDDFELVSDECEDTVCEAVSIEESGEAPVENLCEKTSEAESLEAPAEAHCEEASEEESGEVPVEAYCEETSEPEMCKGTADEDAPKVVNVPLRKNYGIILETCTEKEKVFVFNQNEADTAEPFQEIVEAIEGTFPEEVVEPIEEGLTDDFEPIEEFIEVHEEASEEAVIETVEEISEEDESIMFADEIFIEADIADSDDEEDFENDMFTEEIYVDEDIADEDVAEESVVEQPLEEDVPEDLIEQMPEIVTIAEEIGTQDSYTATEEASVEAAVTEEPENSVGEAAVTEEPEDSVGEAAVTEEPEDSVEEAVVTEELEDSVGEAAVTEESSDLVDQKVTFVGYIDGENNFKPAEEETEKEPSKKLTGHTIEEKAEQQKRPKYGNNQELRILLVECSQMKGGVKYTANKLHNIHQQEGTKLHGIARISDVKLSIRGAESAISVLRGRDLVVEGVDGITYEAVNELMNLLDEDMKPTILAIVDTPTKLALFVNRHRTFAGRCEYIYEEASISRREFLNYINNYAYKLEAVLDDMAEEELEYIADEMIEDGISFTISDAAGLVERALEKAQKPGIKGLFEAKKDSDGYLILRARHFDRG